MRTSAVALAHLDDPVALVEAAQLVSALTHADPLARQACALWCLGIRHAVLTGNLPDLRACTELLPEDSRAFWTSRIDEAEAQEPATFTDNGYVVTALQAAWSAIIHTPVPPQAPGDGSFDCHHLVERTGMRGPDRPRHRHRGVGGGSDARGQVGSQRGPGRVARHPARMARAKRH